MEDLSTVKNLPDVLFKYKVIPVAYRNKEIHETELVFINEYFDFLGSEGWELVAVSEGAAYFKIGYFREAG